MQIEFLKELGELLEKYAVKLTADDHWIGYPECGEDIRIGTDFEDYSIEDIDFGQKITSGKCRELSTSWKKGGCT